VIVRQIIQQHTDDAAALALNRHVLTSAGHARLIDLVRADQRLNAHLDGLRLAGSEASPFYEALLERPSSEGVFVSAVRALEDKDTARLDRLIALAQAVPETVDGLVRAFGWVESPRLQGIVAGLLRRQDRFTRMIGVAACAEHRVDPGILSGDYLRDPDRAVRIRSVRAAGELGLAEARSVCAATSRGDDDPELQFWSAWSAILVGDRGLALDVLTKCGLSVNAHRARSFQISLQAMTPGAAHAMLQHLARDPTHSRWLIQGSGIAGDPAYIPWLIKRMGDLQTARLAAEAFTLITGVDLGLAALDRPAPENFESGPTDDPDDPNVDMDADDGLPWPDVAKIETWWAENESRFPKGTRYFMGAPVTRAHCIDVLKNGYQRQRILAAHYLSLLEPGTPLFNTSAPALRQQRRLTKMT